MLLAAETITGVVTFLLAIIVIDRPLLNEVVTLIAQSVPGGERLARRFGVKIPEPPEGGKKARTQEGRRRRDPTRDWLPRRPRSRKPSRPIPDWATHPMSEPAATPALAEQLAAGALDPDLLALVWMLAESGVPLTVAAADATAARELRNGICALLPADHHAADLAVAGGTVVAGSLEDVLRVLGGGAHAGHRRVRSQ